jgi:hypothetical protein
MIEGFLSLLLLLVMIVTGIVSLIIAYTVLICSLAISHKLIIWVAKCTDIEGTANEN